MAWIAAAGVCAPVAATVVAAAAAAAAVVAVALLGSSYRVKVVSPNQQHRLMMRMDKITETKQLKQFTQLRDVESSHLDSRPIIW